MKPEQKYKQLMALVERHNASIAKLTAQREVLTDELESKHECKTLDKAKRKRDRIAAEVQESKQTFVEKLEEFESQFASKLKRVKSDEHD